MFEPMDEPFEMVNHLAMWKAVGRQGLLQVPISDALKNSLCIV
jgi:hypothetical protein